MTTQGKHGADAGTEELRQEVDRARHDLGDTVEQLAAKADVKAMAKEKIARVRGRARETASSTRDAAARARGDGSAEQAKRGGVAVASVGALALGALVVWRHHSSSSGTGLRQGMKTRMPSPASRHSTSRHSTPWRGKSRHGWSRHGRSRRGKSRWATMVPARGRTRPWQRRTSRGRRRTFL
ncbi:hypothetical protein GCM10022254_11440 [Actinomadura meridiana]|uniref:DUF3618 domain-containing protein n=1 Tax=Actinomadura meridiana TaxID=559626 RepID=A0ABP8BU93_9ACTN